MVEELFEELSKLEQVEAIALGGSRQGENYDEKSDYDVYLYVTAPIPDDVRRPILQKFCKYMEIGNHYWEMEDNCTLNNGVDIDILYRDLDFICNEIADGVERFQPRNGYSTCLWHNLKTCKIICDKNGRLAAAKKRFDVPYPEKLRENIIKRNMNLLSGTMPAYDAQIAKAVSRGDKVSITHRTAAFLESYFDVIFALNCQTHPGEKRLMSLARKNCEILPANFEENLNSLFADLLTNPENVKSDLERIVTEMKNVITSMSSRN